MERAQSTRHYTVGWICAQPIEYVAARSVLDVIHDGGRFGSQPGDNNSYTFGSIASHNVILVLIPSGTYGLSSAATVARDMFHSFPHLQVGLVVGVGSGPTHDIHLGDVVVRAPSSERAITYQYDFERAAQGRGFHSPGTLKEPPAFVLAAVTELAVRLEEDNVNLSADFDSLLSRWPYLREKFARPENRSNLLFPNTYFHPNPDADRSEIGSAQEHAIVPSDSRRLGRPKTVVHYDSIPSTNQVIKSSIINTGMSNQIDISSYRSAEPGLIDQVPSLVIRGICDYADSYKNDGWEGYTAMIAAIYARRLLMCLPAQAPQQGIIPFGSLGQVVGQRRGSMQRARRRVVAPVAQNPRFTGRDAILEAITTSLSISRGEQTRIALIGMGGVGKTEIARAFINSPMAMTTFSTVLWVFAQSRIQTIKSFSKLAAALDLGQPLASPSPFNSTPAAFTETEEMPKDVSAVLDWMSDEQNQDWLLVVDNLDDLESFDIDDFLPDVPFGHIIFTSRRKSAGRLGRPFDIGVMSDSEAVEMLNRCSGKKDSAHDGAAQQLTHALGNLPLALDQAAAYIAAQDSTYDHYHDLLQDGQAELLSHKLPRAVWRYEHTVYTTWQVSMSQIARENPLAAELINIAALFPADDVPLELVCQSQQQTLPQEECFLSGFFDFVPTDGNYDAILGPLPTQLCRTRQSFASAIGLLISFSLLSRTAALNTFSIHPLVHSWLNHCIDSSGRRSDYIYSVVGLINRAIFWSCDTGNLKHTQLLYPHVFNLNRLLESAPQTLETVDVTRLAGCLIAVDAWATLSVDWTTLRSADEFFAMIERVRTVADWQISEELWLLREICRCRAQGRLEESARLCEELFHKPPATSTYQSMYRCCIALTYSPFVYRHLQYDRAKYILDEYCITDCDRTKFLLARKDLILGSIELDIGNLDKAERLLRSCEKVLHSRVGQEYFLLAVWYQRMGLCLLLQGRIHESETLVWSLLQHKVHNLDVKSQFFAFCDYELLECYARCLRVQKRFGEIQDLIQDVLQKTSVLQPPLGRALGELSLQITILESICKQPKEDDEKGSIINESHFFSILEEARRVHERSLKAFEQEWKRGFWIFQDFNKVVENLLAHMSSRRNAQSFH